MRKKTVSSAAWTAACLAILFVHGASAPAGTPPESKARVSLVGGLPVMVVDRSTQRAQGWLHVQNSGEGEVPLLITVGHFVSQVTGRPLATEAAFFLGADTPGSPFVESRIPEGGTVRVRLEVSNLWEAGESAAELSINGTIHTLKAAHYDVPFRVGLHSSSPDQPLIELHRDQKGLLVLRNEDAMTYTVAWWLAIPSEPSTLAGETALTPRSLQPLVIDPPAVWFGGRLESLFKDVERPALLSLSWKPPMGSRDWPGGPATTLPVRLRLSSWSDGARGLWSGAILLGVLLLGGICSLLLGMWIPNKLARIELAGRLGDLAQKTRAISRKTDSALRVGVRVERLRLWETLRDLGMLAPDAAERLKLFERDIGVLSTRIELVALLDEVSQRLETLRAKTSGAPPTPLWKAGRFLDEATRLLKLARPTETDFQAAQVAARSAASLLDRLEEVDPHFAETLAARIHSLRVEYDAGSGDIGLRPKCGELREKLTDLFVILKDKTYESPAEISPSRYHWIDMSVEKLYVLRHYILRFEDTRADPARHDRVGQCEARLVELLRLQSPYTLDLARRLKEQIEQDVLTSDVLQQLDAGNVGIKTEPLTARPNEPVRLWLEFADPRFRHCAALSEFRCLWEFQGSVGQEQGWEIVHYFRNEREARFHVHFTTSDGKPIGGTGAGSSGLQKSMPLLLQHRKRSWERWVVEGGRLALALLIAILALVGGAREQLMKLDILPGLVAVFLLGFGADTVKNLFARRS
jgi:hypothetical protein